MLDEKKLTVVYAGKRGTKETKRLDEVLEYALSGLETEILEWPEDGNDPVSAGEMRGNGAAFSASEGVPSGDFPETEAMPVFAAAVSCLPSL